VPVRVSSAGGPLGHHLTVLDPPWPALDKLAAYSGASLTRAVVPAASVTPLSLSHVPNAQVFAVIIKADEEPLANIQLPSSLRTVSVGTQPFSCLKKMEFLKQVGHTHATVTAMFSSWPWAFLIQSQACQTASAHHLKLYGSQHCVEHCTMTDCWPLAAYSGARAVHHRPQ
jgi:hypothetical protein